jgi:hypothetical protein
MIKALASKHKALRTTPIPKKKKIGWVPVAHS